MLSAKSGTASRDVVVGLGAERVESANEKGFRVETQALSCLGTSRVRVIPNYYSMKIRNAESISQALVYLLSWMGWVSYSWIGSRGTSHT